MLRKKTYLTRRLVGFGALGEFGVFEGTVDVEGEGDFAVGDFGAFEAGEGVGEKTLLGGDGGDALVVEFVGAGNADAARAVDIDSVPVNVDDFAGDPEILEFEVGGNRGEGSGIFFCGAEIVEAGELHQVGAEHEAGGLAVGQLDVAGTVHVGERPVGVFDGAGKLEVTVESSGEQSSQVVKVGEESREVDPFCVCVGFEGRGALGQADGKIAGGFSGADVGFEIGEKDFTRLQSEFCVDIGRFDGGEA